MAKKPEKEPKVEYTKEELASFADIAEADKSVRKRQPKQEKETEQNEKSTQAFRESLHKGEDNDPVRRRELRRGK